MLTLTGTLLRCSPDRAPHTPKVQTLPFLNKVLSRCTVHTISQTLNVTFLPVWTFRGVLSTALTAASECACRDDT